MTTWGRLNLITLTIGAVLLAPTHSNAAATGKIYINGKWESANVVEKTSMWDLSGLFGNKEPASITDLAKQFLEENAPILRADSSTTWKQTKQQIGSELSTVRSEKFWKGLPVMGADSAVQVANGKVLFANADGTNLDQVSTAASISPSQAKAIAFSAYQGKAQSAKAPELKVVLVGDAEKTAHLAYEVTVYDRDGMSSDIHFIDAQRGDELMATTNIQTITDRKILGGMGDDQDFDVIGGTADASLWKTIFADKGCTETTDPLKKNPANPATPTPCATPEQKVLTSATSAWNNAGMVHSYFLETHSRDSIDGAGMLMSSVVNFGNNFSNAAWVNDKSVMVYGMGDGVQLNDFAIALDVAGHEMTHGVTARSAALQYQSESGALNESFSDVFGKLVAFKYGKTTDWKLGKELFKDGTSFVRDMENPEIGHVRDQKYKGQRCSRYNDFCGVHTNSGIPNKVAVLISKDIGLEKMGKLYYLTLTQLLRSTSDFKEAKAQTLAACSTLFGAGGKECASVTTAFTAVGIE